MFRWSTVELTAPTPTIESTTKESVSAEKIPIEGRSVDRVAIARESKEPGLREVAGNATRTTDQVNARLRFFLFLRK